MLKRVSSFVQCRTPKILQPWKIQLGLCFFIKVRGAQIGFSPAENFQIEHDDVVQGLAANEGNKLL